MSVSMIVSVCPAQPCLPRRTLPCALCPCAPVPLYPCDPVPLPRALVPLPASCGLRPAACVLSQRARFGSGAWTLMPLFTEDSLMPCRSMQTRTRKRHRVFPQPGQPTSSRGDGQGYIFMTDGTAGRLQVQDGAAVELGGRLWVAAHTEAGLCLSIVTAHDDGRQRVAQRVEDNTNEVQHRKLEIEALRALRRQLLLTLEEVRPLNPPASFGSVCPLCVRLS